MGNNSEKLVQNGELFGSFPTKSGSLHTFGGQSEKFKYTGHKGNPKLGETPGIFFSISGKGLRGPVNV